MRIPNILLEMNDEFSVKCWQKVCTKLSKLNLKIAFFQLLRGKLPFRHPLFSSSMATDFSGKCIKTGKGGRNLDIVIANILS